MTNKKRFWFEIASQIINFDVDFKSFLYKWFRFGSETTFRSECKSDLKWSLPTLPLSSNRQSSQDDNRRYRGTAGDTGDILHCGHLRHF